MLRDQERRRTPSDLIRREVDRVLERFIDAMAAEVRLLPHEQKTLCTSMINGRPVAIVALPEKTRLPLTKRQREIVHLVGGNLGNAGIGSELGISESTVKYHLKRVYARWHLGSRAALARCGAVLFG